MSLFWEEIPRFEIGDWWKDEELPLDFRRFGSFSSVCCEVGFGHGEFIFSMAEKDTEKLFVGIERYGEGLRKILRAIRRSSAPNIMPLCGDGYVILQVAFADESLESVFVNFPDPWPKKRHEERRLFTREFFSLCARKLKRGGRVNFATDDRALAKQGMDEIGAVKDLVNENPPPGHLARSPHPFQTRYERKWMSEGKSLFYFTYGKA